MRDNELEIATAPAGERARQYDRAHGRTAGPPLLAQEIRMIKIGARVCGQCRHRASSVPTGNPHSLQALCDYCFTNDKLDRQVEAQRARREGMRRRA